MKRKTRAIGPKGRRPFDAEACLQSAGPARRIVRNIRIEADLVDQLFNSSEKRLARTLLLLARYGQRNRQRALPKISQETLAEMIGALSSPSCCVTDSVLMGHLAAMDAVLDVTREPDTIVRHACLIPTLPFVS